MHYQSIKTQQLFIFSGFIQLFSSSFGKRSTQRVRCLRISKEQLCVFKHGGGPMRRWKPLLRVGLSLATPTDFKGSVFKNQRIDSQPLKCTASIDAAGCDMLLSLLLLSAPCCFFFTRCPSESSPVVAINSRSVSPSGSTTVAHLCAC